MFDYKAALTHYDSTVDKGIFGQGNGREINVKVGRIAVHQIDHQRRLHQIRRRCLDIRG